MLIENWRRHYNTVIYSFLAHLPSAAPEPILPPHFSDGTVFVKEVFRRGPIEMTTGTVSSAGALAGWLVGVKHHRGLFPSNQCSTAGVAWFDATNPQKTTSTDYTTDCQSCHVPARQSDWIYTHGYPVLTR